MAISKITSDAIDATDFNLDSGRVLIGQDSGDAFNDDSMLRIQRTGDRVFQQFKCDADQNVQILFGDVDDAVECAIQYHPSDKDLRFTTGNNAEAMRILSGGGITFNGDTAAANALDDYEEGTWTPEIRDNFVSSGNTASYATQVGTYTKIGNIVHAQSFLTNINTTGMTSGNAVYLTGLPYSADSQPIGTCVPRLDSWSNGGDYIVCDVAATYLRFKRVRDGGTDVGVAVSAIVSGTADCFVAFTYKIA